MILGKLYELDVGLLGIYKIDELVGKRVLLNTKTKLTDGTFKYDNPFTARVVSKTKNNSYIAIELYGFSGPFEKWIKFSEFEDLFIDLVDE